MISSVATILTFSGSMKLKINSVQTTMCSQKLMKVLQEVLDFHWTWTVLLLLTISEAQQHFDLRTGHR